MVARFLDLDGHRAAVLPGRVEHVGGGDDKGRLLRPLRVKMDGAVRLYLGAQPLRFDFEGVAFAPGQLFQNKAFLERAALHVVGQARAVQGFRVGHGRVLLFRLQLPLVFLPLLVRLGRGGAQA